jgi:hypothetical protein
MKSRSLLSHADPAAELHAGLNSPGLDEDYNNDKRKNQQNLKVYLGLELNTPQILKKFTGQLIHFRR